MTSHAVEVSSRAQLLEKVRERVRKHNQILWPTVSEKIQYLKAKKSVEANKNPDHEYRTVFHLDLDRANLNGVIEDSAQVTEPEAGWAGTIKGMDCDGASLCVMVFLSLEESQPLQITDFVAGN
jgi:hypothetical protein